MPITITIRCDEWNSNTRCNDFYREHVQATQHSRRQLHSIYDDVKKIARLEGYRKIGGRWYCPNCVEAR